MRGRKFIKVTSIIMLILGAIAFIRSIISFAQTNEQLQQLSMFSDISAIQTTFTILLIVSLLGNAAMIIAGILGLKYCEVSDTQPCIVMGFITIAFNVVSIIVTVMFGNAFAAFLSPFGGAELGSALTLTFTGVGIFAGIINSVLPVLYLVGAFLNKNDKTHDIKLDSTYTYSDTVGNSNMYGNDAYNMNNIYGNNPYNRGNENIYQTPHFNENPYNNQNAENVYSGDQYDAGNIYADNNYAEGPNANGYPANPDVNGYAANPSVNDYDYQRNNIYPR